jgi:predicted permease
MLLVLVCGNVALLMFARAATRESEIVVRNALGATRGRIVAQLFAEALVLGGVACVVGLAGAGFGLRWLMNVIEGEGLNGGKLPFWFSDRLSPATILYAIGLTVLGAAIAGIVPARKVTRALGARLREGTAGGGGLQFGGVWTAVIVAQVAVTVAFPVTAMLVRRDEVQIETADVGFPAEDYLTLRVSLEEGGAAAPRMPLVGRADAGSDSARAAFGDRYRASWRELERRLAADPAVVGVTFADRLPRMYHPYRLIEVDAGGAAPLHPQWPAYRVSAASVDPRFFDVVGVPVRLGRGFHAADMVRGAHAVIVNESFVNRVLGGRNPIGRRLRYVHYEEWQESHPMEPGPWYEIVGVVRDMGMAIGADVGAGEGADPKVAGIYHPADVAEVYPARVAIHVRGDPMAYAPRLRELADAADPRLQLEHARTLDRVNDGELQFLAYWFRLLVTMSAIALTLSLAGIYAVMSFTVARRTREIGIRIALGADRRRIVLAIFRRPLLQVSLGIVAGAAIVVVLAVGYNSGTIPTRQVAMLVAYALLMTAVCLLACIVPTRRALAVEPTEALRAEG